MKKRKKSYKEKIKFTRTSLFVAIGIFLILLILINYTPEESFLLRLWAIFLLIQGPFFWFFLIKLIWLEKLGAMADLTKVERKKILASRKEKKKQLKLMRIKEMEALRLKEKKEMEMKNRAIANLKNYVENSEELYLECSDWSGGELDIYVGKGVFSFEVDKIINLVIQNDYNAKEVITQIVEDILVEVEANKILERQKKRKIREAAEKKLYGVVKTKRKNLTEEEKEMVFDKFNNECAVCGKKEGLHIHHKDENPSNNQMSNLVVLCGVCHKKTHMRVR